MTEPDRRRSPFRPGPCAVEHTYDMAHRGKLFLEHARIDPRRANIVIQLAESAGDRIDSLSGYIDMLLAILSAPIRFDEVPASAHVKYVGWLAELGALEHSL